jgi:hypothetical protein
MYRVEVAFGRGLRLDLKSKDIVLVVSDENGKIGELRVSKGSVDWWHYMARTKPTTLTWDRFDELMQQSDHPRRGKVRRPLRAKRAS